MRTPNLIAAAVLALALAAPAKAEFWNAPNNAGTFDYPIRPSTGETMAVHFGYDALTGQPTWKLSIAETSFNVLRFEGPTQTFRGGQPLGGTYRAPLGGLDGGTISLSWISATDGNLTDFARSELGTLRLANDPLETITRTEIEAGRPPRNTQIVVPNGWYWNPDESGSGYALEVQGSTLFVAIFSYETTGEPTWYITTGAMTTHALYAGSLQRCTRDGAVVCADQGTISLTLREEPATLFAAASPRIDVTLPNGATTTLRPYRF